MAQIKIGVNGLNKFMKKLNQFGDADLRAEVVTWLDACGMQFLEEVQNMIKRMEVVDTRLLINSFTKGDGNNVWTISHGGLRLDIGTNVEYARYVNDGHYTDSSGRARRWIPGTWKGDKFEYDPSAKTGMSLKFQWVEGRPYWDNALVVFEKMFQESFKRSLVEWSKRIRL